MEAPCGAWASPLTAERVTGASLRLVGAALDTAGRLLWLESRPTEAGRTVLVRQREDGRREDVTPAGSDVRTLAHEYGGGALCVAGDFAVYSNFADQRLYRLSISGDRTPIPVTPDVGGRRLRFADGAVVPGRRRLVCVCEDHRAEGREATNSIVAVDLDSSGDQEPQMLVEGTDFYAAPRPSSDGRRLAWIQWSHPAMPWDCTELCVADIGAGKVENVRTVAASGSSNSSQAPCEPVWSPSGELFFVSDVTNGFWNIHRWVEKEGRVEAITELGAEFTTPAWQFGNRHFAFLPGSSSHILCSYRYQGVAHLAIVNVVDKSLKPVATRFTDHFGIVIGEGQIYMLAGSPTDSPSIVKIELADDLKSATADEVVYSSSSLDIDELKPYISMPEIFQSPTTTPGQVAHAIFYPPHNKDYISRPGELPPLLVRCHGGPTSETGTSLKLSIQYWTSRGWAVADVNYGGSTGYGREYRERLYGKWGIVDLDDCCSCAESLAAAGKVDPKRLAIDGGSAGGYTTLAVLAFRSTFKAGCSFYGVADLMLLAQQTHKFESRYLDQLLGPVDTAAQIYHDRSPLFHADRISCPVILFQGLEDEVVPPNQAEMMYKAIKANSIPTALVEYEGEQHGFRKAENQKNTLEQEMLFFARVLGGFLPADPIKPIHIDNFDP
eukprot:SM000047S16867  [mRNA]  locus=s47:400272:406355:+ [translate_table: standard]